MQENVSQAAPFLARMCYETPVPEGLKGCVGFFVWIFTNTMVLARIVQGLLSFLASSFYNLKLMELEKKYENDDK